jgi:branched-chain amino acid transport system ATP-binding protein
VALFPELEPRLGVKAGLLSGGEQQMLLLARLLARRPKVLLIDELSLGLAPNIVERVLERIRQAASESGVGVLMVEQYVRRALRHADRVYILRRGRVEMTCGAAEASERLAEIEDLYLSSGSPSGES